MGVTAVNIAELEYRLPADGVRFAVERADVGARLGSERLSIEVLVLPPGKADGPYRFHLIHEHVILVLGGQPRIRLGGVEYGLAQGSVVALPARASCAHQLLNRYPRPAHLLIAGTNESRDVIGLPDSGKRIYRIRTGPGRDAGAEVEDVILQGDRIVDLLEGEPVDVPLGPAPPEPEAGDPRIAPLESVPWKAYAVGPFRAERRRLAPVVGAEALGYSLYRVAPGDRPWAYHFHHTNEEFFAVRSGRGWLRTPQGDRELRAGDLVVFPPGPAGAHGVTSAGDAPLEYFALSSMVEPEVVEYPDSDKTAIMVGAAPGGDPSRRDVDLMFRRQDAVPYEEGER